MWRAWLMVVLGLAMSARGHAAFSPRTEQERREALGDLAEVLEPLRTLLTPDEDFALIAMPEPGDWLDRHVEGGQTFDEFLEARRNRPDEKRRTIYLLPLGAFSRDAAPDTKVVAEYARIFFQLPVKVLPPHEPGVMEFEPRVNARTEAVQWHTAKVLDFLKKELPDDAFCLLAITMQDLYPQASWNYVFGQASLSQRVGVYSFSRYDPAFFDEERPREWRRTMLRRSLKVLAHEAGHMFGMLHCIYFDCVMNGSNHLAESDARTMHLCPVCLRKLQHSVQFDPVKRYEELARFYRKHRWVNDAEWCERQVAKAKKVSAGSAK